MGERPKITQEMIEAYEEFTHVTLDRRGFMEKLTKLAGSAAAATTIASMIGSNYALADTIPADDKRIKAQDVSIKGPAGDVKGYLVMPANATGKLPAVVVISQNRGLNPHIRDVTRRLGAEGFLAFGPDLLSRLGGTPGNDDEAGQLFGKADKEGFVPDLLASAEYLRTHAQSNGKVGTVGFCVGGGLVLQLAAADARLAAGVSYYGPQPPADSAKSIKAKMMLHYAELDKGITGNWPAFKTALDQNKVYYQAFVYQGVNHAFNDDTSQARYNQSAADLAWSRTLRFLSQFLA